MKKCLLLVTLVMAFAMTAAAQTAQPKVYIVPSDDGFDGFLTAALIDKKVPVSIVMQEDGADYVIVGTSVKGNNKWSDTVFGSERDRNQGSVRMVEAKTKAVVFAASAGDKSTLFTGLHKTGPKKVADRLADKLNEYFKKHK